MEKGLHLPVALSSDNLSSFSSLSKVLLEDEMLEAEQLSLSFSSSFCLSFSLSEALSSGSSSSTGSSWLSAPLWADAMSWLASSAPCPASASSSGSWSLPHTDGDKSRDYIKNRFFSGGQGSPKNWFDSSGKNLKVAPKNHSCSVVIELMVCCYEQYGASDM